VLPHTAVCKTVPEGVEVKARGALPSSPTKMLDIVVLLIYTFVNAPVAQWLEQRTHNPLVTGSSPVGGTTRRI